MKSVSCRTKEKQKLFIHCSVYIHSLTMYFSCTYYEPIMHQQCTRPLNSLHTSYSYMPHIINCRCSRDTRQAPGTGHGLFRKVSHNPHACLVKPGPLIQESMLLATCCSASVFTRTGKPDIRLLDVVTSKEEAMGRTQP